MLILSRSCLGVRPNEAKETKDDADELAARMRPGTANCQSNQSGSELGLLRLGEFGFPLKLAMNRHKRVK